MRRSLLFLVFLSFPAFAYIDPNVGSMLLQGFIATVAAGAAAVSLYWSKVKSYFSNNKSDKSDAENNDEQ